MKRFEWMVAEKINKYGIWFRGTITGTPYVLYWNPLRTIVAFIKGTWCLGLFPMLTKHIKQKF